MHATFKEAAATVLAAINAVSPVAPEEQEQYAADLEEALREDTGGDLRRTDFLTTEKLVQKFKGTGFFSIAASIDILFPKTMTLIQNLEKGDVQ